ncbi:EamA family transporter (plasmid) [Erwinia sp. E602]|nr:EamA family transporter [Erwinia sp. E602]
MVSTTGTLQMTAAMLVAGTTGWLVIASGQDALTAVFYRCLFGAVAMALVCFTLPGSWQVRITLHQWLLVVAGGIALVLNWVLLFTAYASASVSVATVTYHTQPFMLTALSALLFREKISRQAALWLGVAFAGVVLIVSGGQPVRSGGEHYLSGVLLALGAAFCYSLVAIVARSVKHISPQKLVLIQLITGTLLLLPFMTPIEAENPVKVWSLLLILGVVHTALMSTLLYAGIGKLSGSLVAALSFIYPVVTIVVDWLVFAHRLTLGQFCGALIILIATAASYRLRNNASRRA